MEQFYLNDGEVCYNGPVPASNEEAVQISISKWLFVAANLENLDFVNHSYPDGARSTCGCCMRYNTNETRDEEQCVGCPVREESGQSCCMYTPFDLWTELSEGYAEIAKNDPEYRRRFLCMMRCICQQELAFLRKLLDKKRRRPFTAVVRL
jgi:hypothetical protein